MAVRLSLKTGLVSDHERLPDSADVVVVVEPNTGSVARTKGQLYLLVTSQLSGNRAREATRLVADTIRTEYYYDESAGIRACLEKVIGLANRRLSHHRDRLGMAGRDGTGPLGVGVAVVRGNELYVVTAGPAEAYLIRGARLSTLPDPNRERGLPIETLGLDVWRGELAVGDSLVLVSPNVVARVGPEELKDQLVTLHPQPAMEQLHARFAALGGTGSDGAVAFEATEIAATQRHRTLVPVRADEPLAGAPDRSPIPLADTVTDGVAAVQESASQARRAAGGLFGRAVGSVQDRLPRRSPRYRRVTPLATRQETQRRAAVALLALVLVAGGLGAAVWFAGGAGPKESVASLTAGQRALQQAQSDIDTVWAPGVDLVTGDPQKAQQLLEDAYQQLGEAGTSGVPATTIDPLRTKVVGGLNDLYGVVEVRSNDAYVFPSDTPVDLTALIRGPDGKPYVIDADSGSVLRIDPAGDTATVILKAGSTIGGVKVGPAKLMTVGGPDLLILDTNNELWRWRPADNKGRGTVVRVKIVDSKTWGTDVTAIGTFCRTSDCALYNLYVVDPSAQQIMTYSPAADGTGYPAAPVGRLATARDVSGFSQMYIDGDIYVIDAGVIERFVGGRDDGWKTDDPADTLLRPTPSYAYMASYTGARKGTLYAYDPGSARVIAFQKANGSFIQQYLLPPGDPAWRDVRGIYAEPGPATDAPDTLYWIEGDRLESAILEATLGPIPSTSPSASPAESTSPAASPAKGAASAKP